MNNSEYKRRRDKWDKLASTWIDTGPPASPSKGDIENYKCLIEEVIDDTNEIKVMILGCTPSLRIMLAEMGRWRNLDVVCVDFSAAMYKRTTELIQHQNHQERFVLSDWLTMDIAEQKFDAILGDKVIDNIMPEDWLTFFERIHYHLKSHSYFIVHLAPQNMALKNVSFSESLNKWAELYKNHKGTLESVVSGFWEEILGASAFKDSIRYNTQKIERFANEVEAIYNEIDSIDRFSREIFEEFIRVFWESRRDEWSSYDYKQILNLMKPYFAHDRKLFSADYEVAPRQPIVRMKSI